MQSENVVKPVISAVIPALVTGKCPLPVRDTIFSETFAQTFTRIHFLDEVHVKEKTHRNRHVCSSLRPFVHML
jgi:hypothetical protein